MHLKFFVSPFFASSLCGVIRTGYYFHQLCKIQKTRKIQKTCKIQKPVKSKNQRNPKHLTIFGRIPPPGFIWPTAHVPCNLLLIILHPLSTSTKASSINFKEKIYKNLETLRSILCPPTPLQRPPPPRSFSCSFPLLFLNESRGGSGVSKERCARTLSLARLARRARHRRPACASPPKM